MTDTQQEGYSLFNSPPPPRSVFATKIPSTVTFSIGLLLFFLPFAELKCKPPKGQQDSDFTFNVEKFSLSNSGVGLAIGSAWKWNMPIHDLFRNDSFDMIEQRTKPQRANTYALVALIMAVAGLAASFINTKPGAVIATVTGGITAGALIGLMIDLNRKSHDIISEMQQTGSGGNAGSSAYLTLDFTPWFFIAIVAMVAAAVFSYKRILSAGP